MLGQDEKGQMLVVYSTRNFIGDNADEYVKGRNEVLEETGGRFSENLLARMIDSYNWLYENHRDEALKINKELDILLNSYPEKYSSSNDLQKVKEKFQEVLLSNEHSAFKKNLLDILLNSYSEKYSSSNELQKVKEKFQEVLLSNEHSAFKKNLDELILRFSSEPLTYAVDGQLTEDYWSNYDAFRDMQEVAVEEPDSIPDLVSFSSIVDDLFRDPVNIDDLEYLHDRVYGIRINEEIFGFIIKRADDDEIQKSLDDADYVIKEHLILKSNHEYFIELMSLILQVEFCKKYIDKN